MGKSGVLRLQSGFESLQFEDATELVRFWGFIGFGVLELSFLGLSGCVGLASQGVEDAKGCKVHWALHRALEFRFH